MRALYQNNKDIPDDMLLGNLLFMTMTKMKVSADQFKVAFIQNGVPESFIRSISSADAFRRATSSVRGVDKTTGYKIEVDEVRSDKQGIKKVIGIKRPDMNDGMEYVPAIEMYYDRYSELASFIVMQGNLTAQEAEDFKNMGLLVKDRYDEWKTYHTEDTIKNTINRIVESMYPVNLMPTGICKFIPKSRKDLVYGLQGALNDLSEYAINPGDKNVCEIIPVISTDQQARLIENNCDKAFKEEALNMVVELKDIIKNKSTISVSTAANYIQKFNTLSAKVKEYEGLLGVYLETLHNQIKDAVELIDNNKETP